MSSASGLDFAMVDGTEVLAAADGEITFVQPNPGPGWSKYVEVYYPGEGVRLTYAHLSSIRPWVAVGVKNVKVGDIIGESGSGHLHLDIGFGNTWHGKTIDGYQVWMVTVKGDASKGFRYAGTMTKGSTTTSDEDCVYGGSVVGTGTKKSGSIETAISGEDSVSSSNCAHEHGTPVPAPCQNGGGDDDRDGDGTPDVSDDCPDDPGPPENNGCPIINQPPTADAGGPYTTNEGANVALTGTANDDHDDPLTMTYEWDFDSDGAFDDATGRTPIFDRVGQDGIFTVRLQVTDSGDLSSQPAEAIVTVRNVAPSVSLSSNAPKDEGSAVTVSGTVTDPGWLDPLSAEIYWGDGTPPEPVGGVIENVRPDATLTFNVSHVYGDNGIFTAEVCADDDDTTTCETIDLQIDNVDPTAEIDMSGAILVNGIPTFIAHIGDPLDFSGRSTDPGSDDLYLSWDWDDGSPVVTTTYLVNPPFPDPYPSPSIQPRDVTDAQTYTYADACFYQVGFWAEDDDGGVSPVDIANVIIVGNAEDVRTAGYWLHQYRSHLTDQGRPHFDAPTLGCYLDIAGYMSQVFDEETDASTFEQAHDVLFVNNTSDMTEMLDRQLLAVWLNFANGSIEYDQMVDTDRDSVPDTVFLDALAAAEAVRLDAGATRMELETKKDFLERLNRMK